MDWNNNSANKNLVSDSVLFSNLTCFILPSMSFWYHPAAFIDWKKQEWQEQCWQEANYNRISTTGLPNLSPLRNGLNYLAKVLKADSIHTRILTNLAKFCQSPETSVWSFSWRSSKFRENILQTLRLNRKPVRFGHTIHILISYYKACGNSHGWNFP